MFFMRDDFARSDLLHVGSPTGSAIDYVVDGENRRVGKELAGTLPVGLAVHVVCARKCWTPGQLPRPSKVSAGPHLPVVDVSR